jgi:hypothetical protein
MKHLLSRPLKLALYTTGVCCVFLLLAWNNDSNRYFGGAVNSWDTVPAKTANEQKEKDLDKQLRELEDAKTKLNNINDQDWPEISAKISLELDKVDLEKIKKDTEKAIREIDVDKINREIKESLKNIDVEKIEKDLRNAIAKIDIDNDMSALKLELDKMKIDVNVALDEAKAEMSRVSKDDMEKIKIDLKKAAEEIKLAQKEIVINGKSMKESMEKAKQGVDKAKKQLQSYQEMIYAMEKDDLLNTENNYTIELRDSDLYINDKKQPASVYNKYKKYFSDSSVIIKKENGELNINKNY